MRMGWMVCGVACLMLACCSASTDSVSFLAESHLEEHFEEDGLEGHSGRVKRSPFDMNFGGDSNMDFGGGSNMNFGGDSSMGGDMSYTSASYWIGGVSYRPDGTLDYLGDIKSFPASGKLEINGVTFLKDKKVIVDGKTYSYQNMGGGGSSQYMASYWIGGVSYLPDGTLDYLGEIKTFPASGKLELNGVTFLKDKKVIVDGKTYAYKNTDNGGDSSQYLGSYWIGGVNYLHDGTLDYLGEIKTFPSSGKLEINGVTFFKDHKVMVKGKKYNYKSTGGDTSQYLGSYWIGGVKYLPDGTLDYLGEIKTFPSSGKLEINGVTFLKDQKVMVDGKKYNYKNKEGDNTDDYLPSYWMGGVKYLPDGTLEVQGKIKRFPSSGKLTIGGVTFMKNRKVIVNGKTYKYNNEPSNSPSSPRTTYYVRGVSYRPDGTLNYLGEIKRFPSNGKLTIGGITFLRDRRVIVRGKTYPYNNDGGSAPYSRPTSSTYSISNVYIRPDGTLFYQGQIYKFPSNGQLTIAGKTFLKNGYIIVNGKKYLLKKPTGKRPYRTSSMSSDPVFLPNGNIAYGGRVYKFPSSGQLTVAGRTFFRNRTVLINNRAVKYYPRKRPNQVYSQIRRKYPIFLKNGNIMYLGRVYTFQEDRPLTLGGKTFYKNRTIVIKGKPVKYRPYKMYARKVKPYSHRRTNDPVYLSNGNIVYRGKIYTFDTTDRVDINGRIFLRNRTVLVNGRAVRYRPRYNKPNSYRRPAQRAPVFLKDGRVSYMGKIYPYQPNGQVIIRGQTFIRGGMILVRGAPVKYDPKNVNKYPGFATSFPSRTVYRRPGQDVPIFMPNGDIKYRGKVYRFKPNGQVVIQGITFLRGGSILIQGKPVKYEPSKVKQYPGFEEKFPTNNKVTYRRPEQSAPVFMSDGKIMFEGRIYPYQPNGQVVINGQTFMKGGIILVRGKPVKYNPKDVRKYPDFVKRFPASTTQPGIAAPVFLSDGTILFQGKIYKFSPKGQVKIKGVTFTKDKKVIIGNKPVPYKPENVMRNPEFKKQFPESTSEPQLDVSKEPTNGGETSPEDPGQNEPSDEPTGEPSDEPSEPGSDEPSDEPSGTDEDDTPGDESPESPDEEDSEDPSTDPDEPKQPIDGNPTYLKNGSVAFDDKVLPFDSDKPISRGPYTFYPNGTVKHNPKTDKLDKLTKPSTDTYGIMPDGTLNYYGDIKKFPSSGKITVKDLTFYRNGTVVRNPHSHNKQPDGKVMEEVPGPTPAPVDYSDYPDYSSDPNNMQTMKGDPTYLRNGSIIIDNKVKNFEPNKPIKKDINVFYPNGTVVHTKHSHKLPKDSDTKPKPDTYSILSDDTLNYYGVIYKFPENGRIEIGENIFLKNGSVITKTHTHQAGPDGKVLQGKPGPKPTISPVGTDPNIPGNQQPGSQNPNGPWNSQPNNGYPGQYQPNNPQGNGPTGYPNNQPGSSDPGSYPGGYNPGQNSPFNTNPQYPQSGDNDPQNPQPGQNYPQYPQPGQNTPYPQPGQNPQYPQPGQNSPYPQPGQNSQYPQPGEDPQYPQPGQNSPYPQPGQNSPYPQPGQNSQYPKPGQISPNPQPGQNSPYPQPGQNYPYPQPGQNSPYPQPGQSSQYPQPGQNYPAGNPQVVRPGQYPSGFSPNGGFAGYPLSPNMGFPQGSLMNPQGFQPGTPEYTMYMRYWTRYWQPSRVFETIDISRQPRPKDKTLRVKPRRNHKPKTGILPHGLVVIDEPQNVEMLGVYRVLKERLQGHRLPGDVRTQLVHKTRPVLGNILTSLTSRLSDGICSCKDTQCFCCANLGSIGSGCLLIEVYNPDSQPGVDLRIMTGETEVASLTMSGGSGPGVCFDVVPYLVEACLTPSHFTLQGSTLMACFRLQVSGLGLAGTYCVTHTAGGDPCITGSPLAPASQ